MTQGPFDPGYAAWTCGLLGWAFGVAVGLLGVADSGWIAVPCAAFLFALVSAVAGWARARQVRDAEAVILTTAAGGIAVLLAPLLSRTLAGVVQGGFDHWLAPTWKLLARLPADLGKDPTRVGLLMGLGFGQGLLAAIVLRERDVPGARHLAAYLGTVKRCLLYALALGILGGLGVVLLPALGRMADLLPGLVTWFGLVPMFAVLGVAGVLVLSLVFAPAWIGLFAAAEGIGGFTRVLPAAPATPPAERVPTDRAATPPAERVPTDRAATPPAERVPTDRAPSSPAPAPRPAVDLPGWMLGIEGATHTSVGRGVVEFRRGRAHVTVVIGHDLRLRIQVRPDDPSAPLDLESRTGAGDPRLLTIAERHACRRIRSVGELILVRTDRPSDQATSDGLLDLVDRLLEVVQGAPPLTVSVSLVPSSAAITTCPWCRDEIEREAADATSCPHCSTPQHAECLVESGGCTVLGCAGRDRAGVRA